MARLEASALLILLAASLPACLGFDTVDGEPCVFPAIYSGALITSCVFLGNGLYCQTQARQWKRCASSAPAPEAEALIAAAAPAPEVEGAVMAADGSPCVLPTYLDGEPISQCVSVDNTLSCWTTAGGG